MDLGLTKKVVLVTGGAQGIGEAISKACSQEGAIAVAIDRDAEACKRMAEELGTRGCKACSICIDLSTAKNCEHAVRETVSKFGVIDALVNNAGINDKIGLEHGSPEDFVSSLG